MSRYPLCDLGCYKINSLHLQMPGRGFQSPTATSTTASIWDRHADWRRSSPRSWSRSPRQIFNNLVMHTLSPWSPHRFQVSCLCFAGANPSHMLARFHWSFMLRYCTQWETGATASTNIWCVCFLVLASSHTFKVKKFLLMAYQV